jgi:superfamily I DNA and/or RNA helicase
MPAVRFIDTAGCGFDEQRAEGGESTCNPDEAQFTVERVRELIEANPAFQCGVIAPYRAQVDVLNRALDAVFGAQSLERSRIDCSTVDAFQGQERDAIVISLTRSNSQGEIGFLKEYRRTNVAITRAKHQLTVIGDGATVAQDAFFARLIEAAESKGFYHSAWEWMHL